MNNFISTIISILIHLIIAIFLVSINLKIPEKEELKLEINLISPEPQNYKTMDISKSNVDILIEEKTIDIQNPVESNYLDAKPLDIKSEITKTEVVDKIVVESGKGRNLVDFEETLLGFIPEYQIAEGEADFIQINWDGEERQFDNYNVIDFNSFPKEIFTGIELIVQFSVSQRGDVFDIVIVPPGSGSLDFDIKIIEYLGDFKFLGGESITHGEIKILYED